MTHEVEWNKFSAAPERLQIFKTREITSHFITLRHVSFRFKLRGTCLTSVSCGVVGLLGPGLPGLHRLHVGRGSIRIASSLGFSRSIVAWALRLRHSETRGVQCFSFYPLTIELNDLNKFSELNESAQRDGVVRCTWRSLLAGTSPSRSAAGRLPPSSPISWAGTRRARY